MNKTLTGLIILSCSSFTIAADSTDSIPTEYYDPVCKPLVLPGRHGPFDYRTVRQNEKDLVEIYHFNEQYAAYRMGQRKVSKKIDNITETPEAGFGYTLWAFPNHHRALAAVENIGKKENKENLGLSVTVHCFFQRAVKFAPDDSIVRALYAYYYARRGKIVEMKNQIQAAESLDPDNLDVLVYIAWSYLEAREIDKAEEYSNRAYRAGYPLPGLKQKIDQARKKPIGR